MSLDHCSAEESEEACDDLTLLLLDTIFEVVNAIKGSFFLLRCRCVGIRRGSGGLLIPHRAVRFSLGETGDTGFETGLPVHWNDVALSSSMCSLTPIVKVAPARALGAVAKLKSKSADWKGWWNSDAASTEPLSDFGEDAKVLRLPGISMLGSALDKSHISYITLVPSPEALAKGVPWNSGNQYADGSYISWMPAKSSAESWSSSHASRVSASNPFHIGFSISELA